MKSSYRFVLALFAFAAFAPAQAQDPSFVASLVVERGTVMTSTGGGEFVTASSGQGLHQGDRLMVSENSSARVNFNNGAIRQFGQPGVYTIPMPPTLGNGGFGGGGTNVGSSAGASAGATAGMIIGTAALGAAAVQAKGDTVPPESPVSR